MNEAAVADVRAEARLRPLFIGILFLGSFLLFLVQPLFARIVLPVLGGSPAVWSTAMVFYQGALLAGYLYAHLLQRLALRAQIGVHLLLFGLAALTLPIGLADIAGARTGEAAALWLLQLLALSIGPVFLVVAAQAPLMQAWFARSSDPDAYSPYFLYAASNAGSLGGLLAYPFLLEPLTALGLQQQIWSAGYLLLLGLVALGGRSILRAGPRAPATVSDTARPARPIGWARRLKWVVLAAIPSGLLISTTTHITTDIMAMPLLWVIPLALYLITFILAFSAVGPLAMRAAAFVAPVSLLVFGPAHLMIAGMATTLFGLLGLVLLFVVAMALHGRLAADRPPAAELTGFYLWLSLGGVVGGLFAGLLAPQLFDWVYEHPILMLAASILIPARPLLPWMGQVWRGNGVLARGLRILVPGLTLALGWWLGASFNPLDPSVAHTVALFTLGGLAVLAIGRPLTFTWILAMLMLAMGGWQQIDLSTIDRARQRSFFGIYTIENVQSTQMRKLLHGTTMHGAQSLDPERARVPLTYYAPQSGVGLAFAALPALAGPEARVGVVGLGTGSLACYASPGQDWTFYEIDPLMVELATDPAVFSFVADCTPDARIVVGDARLKIDEEPEARFEMLVVDAFSSDAIPIHLLTREAFESYMRTLGPDGLLLLHISNRYLDLEPVVAAIARDLGLHARIRSFVAREADEALGFNTSIWMVLARNEAAMARFLAVGGTEALWQQPATRAGLAPWTDGRASVLPVLKPFMRLY